MPSEAGAVGEKYFGKRRKQGDSIMRVAAAIIIDPSLSTRDLASMLGVSVQTVRAALRKILAGPRTCAAKYGTDENELMIAIIIRNGICAARKKQNTQKRKVIPYQGKFNQSKKLNWWGKGNWPAAVAAKKRSISPEAAARWCGQEYQYTSPGFYQFDESRAGRRPGDMPKFLRT